MRGLITHRFGLTIVTILIAASLLIISLPLNTEAADPIPGTISGHVYRSDGHTPASNVKVATLSWPTLPAYSTSDGSYFLKGLTPGNYRLLASGDGYASQYYNNGAPVNVKADSDTPNIDFTLQAIAPITVKVAVPASVPVGSDFAAKVDVTEVTQIDVCQFDVSYDPAILQVASVTSGMIGSTTFPVDMWGFYFPKTQGKIRVLGNFPGIPNVKGSGYLAEIHFQVVGTPGQRSNIEFSNGLLCDIFGEQISPVTWENSSVQVASKGAGDVNGDGQVNMTDITKLELIILGKAPSTPAADVNNDGLINTTDITKLERIILGMP